jgi:hypothetical protein
MQSILVENRVKPVTLGFLDVSSVLHHTSRRAHLIVGGFISSIRALSLQETVPETMKFARYDYMVTASRRGGQSIDWTAAEQRIPKVFAAASNIAMPISGLCHEPKCWHS